MALKEKVIESLERLYDYVPAFVIEPKTMKLVQVTAPNAIFYKDGKVIAGGMYTSTQGASQKILNGAYYMYSNDMCGFSLILSGYGVPSKNCKLKLTLGFVDIANNGTYPNNGDTYRDAPPLRIQFTDGSKMYGPTYSYRDNGQKRTYTIDIGNKKVYAIHTMDRFSDGLGTLRVNPGGGIIIYDVIVSGDMDKETWVG